MRIPFRKPGKYTNLKPDPLLTEGKFLELQKKLLGLKNAQPSAAAEVSRLAELGDFSENAEYQLAKGRLRGINNAILVLEARLHQAEIIPTPSQKDVVQVGSVVTVEFEKKLKKFTILGSSETSPQRGIISNQSPIGSALLGCKVGEVVAVKLVDREVAYRIVGIE